MAALLFLLMLWLPLRSLWGIATLRYELTPAALVITYGWETVPIPRPDITAAAVITPTRGVRKFGTGMPGLQHGRFAYAETGTIFMYSTSARPLTVIETAGRKYGISPDDPEGFLRALAGGYTGVWQPVRGQSPAGMAAQFALPGILSGAVIFLLLYLTQMARTLRYTLTDDALLIAAGWNRIRVPYRDVRQAELRSPPGSPWKLLGAAMPGLYWGGFYWKAAGPSLRLYSTHHKPLVLLTTRRGTIGVTPEDPDGFLAALRQRLPTA